MSDRVSALYRRNIRRLGDEDVILASYGGSGQAIVGNVLQELGLNYVDPYSEILRPDGTSVPAVEHAGFRTRFAATHERDTAGRRREDRPRRPRFAKTHHFPEEFGGRAFRAVWIVVRDPRDALFSWYKWRARFAEESWDRVDGSFEDFLRRPDATGRLPVEDWCSYYLEWTARAERSRAAAVLRFEDLKLDGVETLRRALRSVGLAPGDEELRRALERSSFEAMRAHEDAVAGSDRSRPAQARMMRRGKVDGWTEWMTPELAECFSGDAVHAVAARFGYAVRTSSANRVYPTRER